MKILLIRILNSISYKYFIILTMSFFFIGVFSCQPGGSPNRANNNKLNESSNGRLKIITYNTQHDENAGSYNWSQKLTHFAYKVVAVHKPAIIGLQEVQIRADCSGCDCHELNRTQYLSTLTDAIESMTGIRYLVANTLCEHDAAIGLWCHQWEGNSVIYDPAQVNFYPYNIDKKISDCINWYQIGLMETYNDCLPLPGASRKVMSRAVFEFPIGSKHFFNFYNTHLDLGDANLSQISSMMTTIKALQTNFAPENFPSLPTDGFVKYPPVLVGDMNRGYDDNYADYYDQGPDTIDKIFVGKADRFPSGAWIVPVENSFQKIGGYSDHDAILLELQAIGYCQ